MNKLEIINKLQLTEHVEGGYFARTYCSPLTISTERIPKERSLLTSIFYLLTDERPVGHFHLNKSDIIHYFHCGSPISYLIIHPDGRLEKVIMGNDLMQDQQLQLTVKGGCWKASVLHHGEYGLISEAVAPGFDFNDMEIGSKEKLKNSFPELWDEIQAYIK